MKPPKEYKFRANIDLGNPEAELDQFLIEGFVPKSEFDLLEDVDSPKCIVLGRTGSGKSALLRKLKEEKENVLIIDPESLSLRHLSNSTIINYFIELGVKLDLFYKVLWRHVFIVELVKLHFADNTGNSFRFIQNLKDRFSGDRSKKIALDYLEKWEEKFWEKTEHQIKEVETNLERAFKGELKGELGEGVSLDSGGVFSWEKLFSIIGTVGAENKKGERVLVEVKNKAQKVINELQVDELNVVMKMLQNDVFPKTQKKYFIIIDDLDKNWVDNKIVYELIRALIDVVKEFTRFKQVKIIIALRNNIDKIIFRKNTTRGVQREKMDYLYIDLKWTREELIMLIDNRLKLLMREVYTNTPPTVRTILPAVTKKHGNPIQYMLNRTLERPRDIIDFFNKCIKRSNGKTKFTWEIIKKSEVDYSVSRLRALDDEWLENHGNLGVIYNFLRNGPHSFTVSEIHDKALSYFVDIISNEEVKEMNDKWQLRFSKFGEDFKPIPLLKEICAVLHNVGLLGWKENAEQPISYVNESLRELDSEDINKDYPKFYIHPTFYRALNIKS